MSELFSEWIASIPPQTLVLVPLVAFLESCVVVGLFVSGVFLLTIVSLIYAQGEFALLTLVSLAFLGAFVGDQIGFFVGRTSSASLNIWCFQWII